MKLLSLTLAALLLLSQLTPGAAPKNAGIFTVNAARNAPGKKGSMFTAQTINCAV
ncbi:beta-defensin 123 [Prionailurus iriomotensis]